MTNPLLKIILTAVFTIVTLVPELFPQLTAFPGAEGNGKYASGGRGGKIIEVTNLNDEGPGSFREAVRMKGARIVVFKVSGNIDLKSDLEIRSGDLTIAGQTAPGDGICITGRETTIKADNVIVRFLRFRLGDDGRKAADALSVMNCKNIIIDHCSLSWGIDEVFSFYDNENSTMQWCIIAEALSNSYHFKGEHGYGGIWGGKQATFHHNLLAHNTSRNPRFNGARTKYSESEEMVDFRNNVIYNWGYNSSYGGEGGSFNMVANYYKPGPATKKNVRERILEPLNDEGRWYINGNIMEGSEKVTANNWNGGVQGEYSDSTELKANAPFPTVSIPEETAVEAFNNVLESAGAIFPVRDAVDQRIINDTKNGTAEFEGKYDVVHDIDTSIVTGIIDSQNDVGGWPQLKQGKPVDDTDHDGMPDEWEAKNNLNPGDASDRNNTASSGYTFIEEYLNSIAAGTPVKGGCCGDKSRKLGGGK